MVVADNKMSIYENTEKKFTSFGIAVISDAYGIEVKRVMNGEYSLSFALPKDSKAYEQIKVGRFIKAYDTIYIIRTLEEYSSPPLLQVEIYCEHILFELLDEFRPFLAHRDSTAQYMINSILSGTRFKGTTQIKGAYNLQVSKGSKLRNVDRLAENVSGIRIPSNMPDKEGYFNINLIDDAGIEKGFLVHNRDNLSSIKRIVDGKEIITRLFVYGEEGLTLETAVKGNGKEYIDASNIKDYPKPKEGVIEFENINDVESLYNAGKKYVERVNKAEVSYEIEMAALKTMLNTTPEDLDIGDVIKVIDEDLEVTIMAKITEIIWNPERGNMQVTLEAIKPTLDSVIAGILNSQDTDTGTRRGNVWTEWITVPFINDPITILFNQPYKTNPTVNVEVYGSREPIGKLIYPLEEIVKGDIVYTGVVVHCEEGTGTDIAVQSIGRID